MQVKSVVWGLLGQGPLFTDNASVSILPIPEQPTRGIAFTESVPGQTPTLDLYFVIRHGMKPVCQVTIRYLDQHSGTHTVQKHLPAFYTLI